jgi:hypothetical protein
MFLVVYLIAKYYDMFVFVTIQQSVLSSDWLNYWFDTSPEILTKRFVTRRIFSPTLYSLNVECL